MLAKMCLDKALSREHIHLIGNVNTYETAYAISNTSVIWHTQYIFCNSLS